MKKKTLVILIILITLLVIVKKKAIFQTTFKELMRPFGTWKGILDSVEWLTCN